MTHSTYRTADVDGFEIFYREGMFDQIYQPK